ncbi:MAG: glycosyltransferase family 2 protein [Chitinophagaceae bacterium]|nr:glycosyltransferase family 2 protein [Chitinophagaceae bacterium]
MFSVVIPLYNKEKSVPGTIASVLNQEVKDFELIIVNDGSTDKSLEIVEAIKDDRIIIINKQNGGISSTRNAGIRAAKNPYIAFVDADDYWEPDFLTTVSALISDYPEADAFATGYVCKFNGLTLHTLGVKNRGIIKDYFKLVYRYPVMHASSVCIKKSSFEKVGWFDERMTHGEDYNMWDRLGKYGLIAASPQPCAWYQLDTENRALLRVPQPSKHWMYYINKEEIRSREEAAYYKRYIRRQVLFYFLKGKIKWAWQIAYKQRGLTSWFSYLMVHEYRELKSIPHLVMNKLKKIFFRKQVALAER